MVSSLSGASTPQTLQRNALPSPFDPGLNSWLDRSQPFDHALDQKHWEAFTPQKTNSVHQPPPVQPRAGSTEAIIKQQATLQQDTFQRSTVETTNNRRAELEIPQTSQSVKGQVQQLSDGVRGFIRNLDRLNVPDVGVREAAAAQMAALMEGRKQAQREGSRSLIDRLKEIALVGKADKETDTSRTPQKNEKRVEAIDPRTQKDENLAAGEIPLNSEL